jgi:hypothetical protein
MISSVVAKGLIAAKSVLGKTALVSAAFSGAMAHRPLQTFHTTVVPAMSGIMSDVGHGFTPEFESLLKRCQARGCSERDVEMISCALDALVECAEPRGLIQVVRSAGLPYERLSQALKNAQENRFAAVEGAPAANGRVYNDVAVEAFRQIVAIITNEMEARDEMEACKSATSDDYGCKRFKRAIEAADLTSFRSLLDYEGLSYSTLSDALIDAENKQVFTQNEEKRKIYWTMAKELRARRALLVRDDEVPMG